MSALAETIQDVSIDRSLLSLAKQSDYDSESADQMSQMLFYLILFIWRHVMTFGPEFSTLALCDRSALTCDHGSYDQ